jgi:beta-aspartyl-dipeptidase (metallo-type)
VDGKKLAALDLPCTVIDAAGCLVIPGLLDPHIHLAGAGGEQGFASRTPEVPLDQLLLAGITTAVGLLGTDTSTRHLTTLLGKVRQLTAQGITAYMYTGGFRVPTPTITSTIMDDLILIDCVIGIGEIAIADTRDVEPSLEELAKLVSAGFIGGNIGGKAGVTHFHVGPGKARLALLRELLDTRDLAPDHIYPTHIERSAALMNEAITLVKRGAYVDIDVVEEDLPKWLRYYYDHGGPPEQLTISSDGHAADSDLKLYRQFVACVRDNDFPLEQVLPHLTANTTRVLKLGGKGRLAPGQDADVLVLREGTFDLVHVFARGLHLVNDGQVSVESG